MALTIKHNHQTVIADDPTKDVSATEWNEDHAVTGVLDVANGGTGATTDGKVAKSGDTMSGALTADAGVIVPTRTLGENTGYCANTYYVENRANAWAYAAAGDRVAKSGDTMSGTLTNNAHVQHNSTTTFNADTWIPQGSSGPFQITGNTHPAITFHAFGQFACQFGMHGNGNFFMGGWSHGTQEFQFWTSRDFPNPDYPVRYMRWVYAGDTGGSEIWGSCLTNAYSSASTSLGYGGSEYGGWVNSVSVSIAISNRHRYLQIWTANVGDYATVGWAS